MIDVTETIKAPILQETLSRVMSSPAYTGPQFIGIQALTTPLFLSEKQISVEWRYALDLLKWSHEVIHSSMGVNQQLLKEAIKRVMNFVRHPELVELDLSGLIDYCISMPPIFGKPFTSRLKILRLSHHFSLTVPKQISCLRNLQELYLNNCKQVTLSSHITKLPALKTLEIRGNVIASISPQIKVWAKKQLDVFALD